MQFTVKQSKGKDSIITVTESTRHGYPEDKQVLIFETDQSLQSQSDRAWQVKKAIENYAIPRGFQHVKSLDEKFKMVFEYSAHAHSLQGEFQVRSQIKENDRFKSAASNAVQERDCINQEYGKAIQQLKNLVFALEQKNREKLGVVKKELIETQVQIVSEIGIPEYVSEPEQKRLLNPSHPYVQIEIDHYKEYGQNGVLPDSLDWILELL